MRVLVVNAGSSSIKLTLLGPDDAVIAHASLSVGAAERENEQLAAAIARMPTPDAVGHRVVHGGREFTAPVRVDAEVTRRLYALTDLAPLHQSLALAGIGEVARALPGVPAVACFDTAFHATLPPAAATYALPPQWRDSYGLRRYGFHGLSHAYAARRAAALGGGGRIVVAHLGAGASLAAVTGGRSVDTTMGFTPLEGLVMATRCGNVDPGALLWLLEHGGLSAAELREALEHRSGMRALAGTSDMREIVSRASAGDDTARLAIDVYLHRLRGGIAAMTASLGGLDTLVFTGGVGENQPRIRACATDGLAFLGAAVDADRNAVARSDADITRDGAPVRTLVIAAREDVEIAAHVRRLASVPAGT